MKYCKNQQSIESDESLSIFVCKILWSIARSSKVLSLKKVDEISYVKYCEVLLDTAKYWVQNCLSNIVSKIFWSIARYSTVLSLQKVYQIFSVKYFEVLIDTTKHWVQKCLSNIVSKIFWSIANIFYKIFWSIDRYNKVLSPQKVDQIFSFSFFSLFPSNCHKCHRCQTELPHMKKIFQVKTFGLSLFILNLRH